MTWLRDVWALGRFNWAARRLERAQPIDGPDALLARVQALQAEACGVLRRERAAVWVTGRGRVRVLEGGARVIPFHGEGRRGCGHG